MMLYATNRLSIVHDAVVVIGDVVVLYGAPRVALEVVEQVGGDVAGHDSDVVVSVRTRLLVVQAQGVANLMDEDAFLEGGNHVTSSLTFMVIGDKNLLLNTLYTVTSVLSGHPGEQQLVAVYDRLFLCRMLQLQRVRNRLAHIRQMAVKGR
jgi:hypothetical protein